MGDLIYACYISGLCGGTLIWRIWWWLAHVSSNLSTLLDQEFLKIVGLVICSERCKLKRRAR